MAYIIIVKKCSLMINDINNLSKKYKINIEFKKEDGCCFCVNKHSKDLCIDVVTIMVCDYCYIRANELELPHNELDKCDKIYKTIYCHNCGAEVSGKTITYNNNNFMFCKRCYTNVDFIYKKLNLIND